MSARLLIFPKKPLVIRWLTVALVVLSLFGLAQTTNQRLTLLGSSENLLLIGTQPLRYFLDNRTNTLFIPNAELAENIRLPSGLESVQQSEGLYLRFGKAFQVTLSSDEKRIQAILQQSSSEKPLAVQNTGQELNNQLSFQDERSPSVFFLSNGDPTAVATLLTRLYTNMRVEVDPRQRALLILVNPKDRPLVEQLIKLLDAPRPQIFFEAEVVEVNRSQTRTLGIDYDNLLSFKLSEGSPPSNLLRLGDISRGPLTFSVALNFLQEQGAAQVLARPRVATLDGVEARINATQTTPLIVPGASGSQSVQNITTGIQMRLLPKVSPDGYVEVQISISVSSPTGVTSQGAPQFATRDTAVTIRVKDGEAIAIGGLLETRTIEGVQSVPLLGDIPILGELFKNRTTNSSVTDLVILITPRLITPSGSAAPTAPETPPPSDDGN